MAGQSNGSGGSIRRRIKSHLEFDKIRRPLTPQFVRRLTKFEFAHFKKHDVMRRPSVAFADFEIKDKRSSVKSSLLLLFAILEGVASFVLPITDAFGPPKFIEHQFYFEVFQIFQYIISIVALVYLQALMMYYNRKMTKLEMIRKKVMEGSRCGSKDGGGDDIGENPPSSPEDSPALTYENNEKGSSHYAPEETSSITPDYAERSVVHYALIHQVNSNNGCNKNSSKDSSPTETVFNEQTTTADSDQQQTAVPPILTNKSGSNFSVNAQEGKQTVPSVTFNAPLNRRPTKLGRMFGDTIGSFSKMNPPFARDHEGVNLYLRLGTVLFGFGVMIMDGFRIADQFRAVNTDIRCQNVLRIPTNSIHTIYIFLQTYFLFKYHRIVFNVQKFFIRFIMCHMAVANLGQWLSTVVQEVISSQEEMEEMSHVDIHNITGIGGVEDHTEHHAICDSQASGLVHYLIPCGIEYSLIAGAIFYKLFQRIGVVRQRILSSRKNEIKHLTTNSLETRNRLITGLSYDYPTECHRSHKGLFIGLLLFLATFVALALFNTFIHRQKYFTALYLYQINNIILIVSGIIAVNAALIRIRGLDLRELSEVDAFDDNLLLLGLLAVLFYDMFLLVPAIGARNELRKEGALFVSKAILEMAQALLQTFLILEASRRKTSTIDDSMKKPGRSMITFLFVLNLAMWAMNTFGLKYAENHEIFRAYYSALPWRIITHLCLPLIIFFRFHSTVCLADIWTNAYRMHEGSQF